MPFYRPENFYWKNFDQKTLLLNLSTLIALIRSFLSKYIAHFSKNCYYGKGFYRKHFSQRNLFLIRLVCYLKISVRHCSTLHSRLPAMRMSCNVKLVKEDVDVALCKFRDALSHCIINNRNSVRYCSTLHSRLPAMRMSCVVKLVQEDVDVALCKFCSVLSHSIVNNSTLIKS